MTSFWEIFLGGLVIVLAAMTILWIASVILKNASIVDPFWGMAFVLVGWYYTYQTPEGYQLRKILVLILVSVWGVRLSIYLLWRNWGKGEDFRYQAFRRRYGPRRYWWVSFFQVFMLQGFLAWIVSAPLLGAQIQGNGLNILDLLGLGCWLVGFIFEAGGDYQLARFKADPANEGKLLMTGFWRYTRHPNYFGDAACWWGFASFSFAAGSYWAVVGSIVMTFLLIRISGVALLERSLEKEKPGYQAYKKRTSAFIPRSPKQ